MIFISLVFLTEYSRVSNTATANFNKWFSECVRLQDLFVHCARNEKYFNITSVMLYCQQYSITDYSCYNGLHYVILMQ